MRVTRSAARCSARASGPAATSRSAAPRSTSFEGCQLQISCGSPTSTLRTVPTRLSTSAMCWPTSAWAERLVTPAWARTPRCPPGSSGLEKDIRGAIEPKSSAGRRTVPLLGVLRDFLDQYLLRTGREGEALVFGRTATDPFEPSTIDNRAQEHWEAAELTPITLHECRHTFAPLLIDAGANPEESI